MTNQSHTPTEPTWDEVIDEVLRMVRDAGAVDDNHGAEDWTFSDERITEAKAAINAAVLEHVIGAYNPTDSNGRYNLKVEQRKVITKGLTKEEI